MSSLMELLNLLLIHPPHLAPAHPCLSWFQPSLLHSLSFLPQPKGPESWPNPSFFPGNTPLTSPENSAPFHTLSQAKEAGFGEYLRILICISPGNTIHPRGLGTWHLAPHRNMHIASENLPVLLRTDHLRSLDNRHTIYVQDTSGVLPRVL